MLGRRKKNRDGGAGEAASGEGTTRSRKGVLVKLAKVGLPVVIGLVAYTQLTGDSEAGAAAAPTTLAAPVEGTVLDGGEVRVSLADADAHFALVRMAVVLEADADPVEVENRLPLLADAAVDEVATFNSEQLRGARGPELLRDVLTERADEIFNVDDEQVSVMRVVLTELIVQ